MLQNDLIGDVDRIQQVLLNLTSNATKFVTKTEGIIKIAAHLRNEGQNVQLVVTVANNGSGISEEDQNKLFKPFSKLKDTKKINPNGNGLGLNICKMLCRKLGGDITVSSRPNEWTEFTFWVNVRI